MKPAFVALALAAAALAIAPPAQARSKHHHKRHVTHVASVQCRDTHRHFSWDFLWDLNNGPQWNGCSPPVYVNGKFIGQDPDPRIRHELLRDPTQGEYSDW